MLKATRALVGRVGRFRLIPLSSLAAVLLAGAAVAHHGPDSIFPTGGTWWSCSDQGSATPAFALNCQTDNATLRWWAEWSINWEPYWKIQDNNALLETNTDFDWVPEEDPPVYSGDFETDIIYDIRSDLPSGLIGAAWCDDAINSSQCDQHYVAFLNNTVADSYSLICHETGHAVGLTHGQQASPQMSNNDSNLDCMESPDDFLETALGAHNIHQINVVY